MEKDRGDKYGPRIFPKNPWLPDVRLEGDIKTTSIFQRDTSYPPIFAKNSWTRGVLEKDTQMYFKPSETIGASYTPTAQTLRIQDMPKRKKKINPSPLGEDGKLQYPPKKSRKQLEEERKQLDMKMKPEKMDIGLVDLEDLLSGEYHRRQKREKLLRQKEKKMRNKFELLKWEGFTDERAKLEKLQAILPKHPDEQKNFLYLQTSKEMDQVVKQKDLQRMIYYLTEGIDPVHIPKYDSSLLKISKTKIPEKYKNLKDYRTMIAADERDIMKLYCIFTRKHLLQYVLQDPAEWKRLEFQSFPKDFPTMLIRAPIPWHTQYCLSTQLIEKHYYNGNIIIRKIRDLWFQKYGNMLILPRSKLLETDSPLSTSFFQEKVESICDESRQILEKEWLPSCADIFLECKQYWKQYIPKQPSDSVEIVERFFDCVNMLLSMQLRWLVMKSLKHFVNIFVKYNEGNDFADQYQDLVLTNLPILTLTVKPHLSKKHLILNPSLEEVQEMLHRCFRKILDVSMAISRIEIIMFPEFSRLERFIPSVREKEQPVNDIYQDMLNAIVPNCIGPQKYLAMYEDYMYILNGDAERELDEYFSMDPFPYLKDFAKKIRTYEEIKNDIIDLRRSVPLNLFNIDCTDLNETLYTIVDNLRFKIVNYFIMENRNHNRKICDTFDEMSQKVSGSPDTIAELVALQNYVIECRDVTMYNLKEQIRKTAENVSFLMEHAHLSAEDIQLNCRVFVWPKDMEAVIELAIQRLNMKRDQAEAILKNRRTVFDGRLKKHEKMLMTFRKKDPPILTMEEMEDSVTAIENLVTLLEADKIEAEQINEEEQLLDIDPSPFMNLYKMLSMVEPYDKLWHTVLEFHENYELWYFGPFSDLDADQITEYVDTVWRSLYKLAKTLSDNPGAKRIAEMVRAKVEKFRQFLPVIQTICNKGLQKRHWDKISEIVGVPIVVTIDSTLNDMIESGLPKFAQQLEEIGAAATKEYALQKNLAKMKEEWVDVCFECVPYRETGVNILSAVDDIQVMMDDHILKAQTMRGSPYVKAFEAEMQAWEEKLISMQDILDQWLLCQATWMYLEPIFSSEDIMRQMPTEARNFKTVDRVWRSIQNNTMKDTHVLVATDYRNMLQNLKENNRLLDEIQKGLNDYLEKKRLFFPRFFFLSNDELLEILSETKDPLRVQPHLKKCFEGIYLLDFTKDEEVVGMISAEKEKVPFSGKIVPADAKGMVEKWLVQVEAIMIQSLIDN